MNCNKCIKRVDCKIYAMFKDQVSADWSTENNYCNMYHGIAINDSFEEIEETYWEADRLRGENEELKHTIDNLEETLTDNMSTISDLEYEVTWLQQELKAAL